MILWRRRSPEQLRREIEFFLSTANEWVQAAFYGDPTVGRITETLYKRWEEAGRAGEPLDYATDEELRELHRLAQRYSRMTVYEAMRLVLERQEAEAEGEGEGEGGL